LRRIFLSLNIAQTPETGLGSRPFRFLTEFEGCQMPPIFRIALAAIVVAISVGGLTSTASARHRHGPYPLTRCGPDLAYLCPIHGYFDAAPFHYNLAIYPGCIRTEMVETPYGMRRQPVLICG
jgi:hypothetical protein